MIPQICLVKHDPQNGSYGDCVRACVASILELETAQVPNFYDGVNGEDDLPMAFDRICEYLDSIGRAPFLSIYDADASLDELLKFISSNTTAHYILFGRTAAGNPHVVICKGDKIVHDPAWYRSPIVGANGSHWLVMVIAVK